MKLTIGMLVLVSSLAFGGKAEREFMKSTLTPAINASSEAYKKACGCSLKITSTSTIVSQDDMTNAKHIVEDVAQGATKYCTDDESKKALCKMTSLKIEKGKESRFELKGSEGVATTDGQVFPTFDMMTRQLDK